ncbi:MAG: hypothetical protein MI864_13735, partial [Pseudomonadales bacterium]|nr:hypothetical protein [Pseudomonadales bacterium]
MSLREWLIVIGIIIILGILIDGYRRMRRARSDADNMSRSMNGDNFSDSTPLDEDFNPELPGGGARVVRPGIDSASGDAAFDATKYGANYQPPKARVVQRDSGVGAEGVGFEPVNGLQDQSVGDKSLGSVDVKDSDQDTWAASPGADELEPFFLDQDEHDMHFDGHVKAESGIAQSHPGEDIDDEEPPVLDTRVVTPEPDRFIRNNVQAFS